MWFNSRTARRKQSGSFIDPKLWIVIETRVRSMSENIGISFRKTGQTPALQMHTHTEYAPGDYLGWNTPRFHIIRIWLSFSAVRTKHERQPDITRLGLTIGFHGWDIDQIIHLCSLLGSVIHTAYTQPMQSRRVWCKEVNISDGHVYPDRVPFSIWLLI